MGGKGGGGVKVKPGPLEQQQAAIAGRQDRRAQLLERQFIDPVRNVVTPQILQALGTNPFQTSLSAAERAPLEAQFNQAKSALFNTGQRGGQFNALRSGLERDRALAIGNAANTARQRGIGRALQFAGGAVPTAAGIGQQTSQALQGLSSANQTATQRALQEAQMRQQSAAGKGNLAGTLAKGAMTMFSSRDFKHDIQPFTESALKMVQDTPVYSWAYNGDDRVHVGPVVEECPDLIVDREAKCMVPISYMGLMFAAIKELSQKVQELEGR